MGRSVPVDGLADAIVEGMEEYADLATDTMKKAVRHSAKTVKMKSKPMLRKTPGPTARVGGHQSRRKPPLSWR